MYTDADDDDDDGMLHREAANPTAAAAAADSVDIACALVSARVSIFVRLSRCTISANKRSYPPTVNTLDMLR